MELFPHKKHISDYMATCFYLANSGVYEEKQLFYQHVKNIILEKHADFIGYDLQIIEHKCWSCGGTGVWKKYWYEGNARYLLKEEKCWNCKNGIYQIKKISLKRYILNGSVYHIPCDESMIDKEPVQNIIQGIVKHDVVDLKEAFESFLILLWVYNRTEFYYHVKNVLKSKIQGIAEFVQNLMSRKNNDLPF